MVSSGPQARYPSSHRNETKIVACSMFAVHSGKYRGQQREADADRERFVPQPPPGERVGQAAGKHLKKVSLELGGMKFADHPG